MKEAKLTDLKTPLALAVQHVRQTQFVGLFEAQEAKGPRSQGVVLVRLQGEVGKKQYAAIERTLEAYAKVGTKLAFAHLKDDDYLFGMSEDVMKQIPLMTISTKTNEEEVPKAEETEEITPKKPRRTRKKATKEETK